MTSNEEKGYCAKTTISWLIPIYSNFLTTPLFIRTCEE
jgi:hypothetical protein